MRPGGSHEIGIYVMESSDWSGMSVGKRADDSVADDTVSGGLDDVLRLETPRNALLYSGGALLWRCFTLVSYAVPSSCVGCRTWGHRGPDGSGRMV